MFALTSIKFQILHNESNFIIRRYCIPVWITNNHDHQFGIFVWHFKCVGDFDSWSVLFYLLTTYFFMYFTVHYSFRNWFQAVHLVSRQKTQSKPVCGGKKILNNCIKFASINFYIFHSSTPSFCEAFSGVSWLDRNAMHIIVKIVQFLFFYYFYDSKISWYIVNSQWCV